MATQDYGARTMHRCKAIAISIVAILGAAAPWPALAQAAAASCAAETAALRQIAANVKVAVKPPERVRAGDAIAIAWSRGPAQAEKSPLYLMLAMPEEVRFNGTIRLVDKADLNKGARGPGFIALTGAARAPHDIAYGKGRARAIVPLHMPGATGDGTFEVKPYRAGIFELEWAVVAKTACGERALTVPKREAFEVWPGGGDIVIEDLTTTERADQVVVADGGRYELHIFRGSYKVFDTLTKAKVADRAGWFANFSPGGRFVAAQVGSDRQGRSAFEVLDLVSGTEVANQGEGGPILGWANGDAVLVEGTYPRGELYVVASLIDYHHADRGKDAPLVFPISAAAAGRIASSWASIHFKHDLDRGVTLLRVGSSKEAPGDRLQIVEMASGHRVEFEIKDRLKAQSAWAAYAGGRPVAVSGWDPGERIRLSHFSPDLDTVVSGMDRARALQRQYFHAHSGRASAQLAPRPEADSQRVARGDWRDSIAAILKNKQKLSLSERFTRQLADFGLTLQSSSAPIEALVERTDFDWRSAFVVGHTPRFRGDPAEIERQVLDDVPAARAIVRARNSDDMICSGEDAGGSNPIIQLGKEAFGIWRWSIGERRFWLIQTLCIWKGAEMSRVFLFFGRGNEPIRIEEGLFLGVVPEDDAKAVREPAPHVDAAFVQADPRRA